MGIRVFRRKDPNAQRTILNERLLKIGNSDWVTDTSEFRATSLYGHSAYESKNIPGIRSARVDDLYHDECM